MAVPSFTATNILPPYVGIWPEQPLGFSPYPASIIEVVNQFGSSPARRAILVGLIRLRSRLRALDVTIERQWLDGSFMEAIELSEGRDPGDIDVMSFVRRPAVAKSDLDFEALVHANLDVFSPPLAKANFKCDHYLQDLDLGIDIDSICYWNAVFSHRRNGVWKGFVQVTDEGDRVDQELLGQILAQGIV